MLALFGFLLFIFVVMAGAIAFLGLVLQARLFDQPPEGLYWRAPATSALITAPLVLWSLWTLASPGDTRPLQQSPKSIHTEAFKKVQILTLDDRLETYALIPGGNPSVPKYKNIEDASRPIPTVMKEIRVSKDPDGTDFSVIFKHGKSGGQGKESFVKDSGEYVDDQGRVMERGTLGVIIPTRTFKFILLLLMYALLFTAWISGMLVLMQFPGGYGIGAGIAGAVLTSITILPFLIPLAEKASGR